MLPWPHLSEWMLTRLSCWCLGSGIAVEQNASFYGLPLFETYFSLFLKVAKPDCWIWATFVWMEHLAVQAPGTSLCDWLEDWTIWKIELTHFFFIPPPPFFLLFWRIDIHLIYWVFQSGLVLNFLKCDFLVTFIARVLFVLIFVCVFNDPVLFCEWDPVTYNIS